MARIDPNELADNDDGDADVDRTAHRPDQDGVAALRDIEAETGDESEISNVFDMDDREARELGVDLDNRDAEPGFS